jgi:hypothetical protein
MPYVHQAQGRLFRMAGPAYLRARPFLLPPAWSWMWNVRTAGCGETLSAWEAAAQFR